MASTAIETLHESQERKHWSYALKLRMTSKKKSKVSVVMTQTQTEKHHWRAVFLTPRKKVRLALALLHFTVNESKRLNKTIWRLKSKSKKLVAFNVSNENNWSWIPKPSSELKELNELNEIVFSKKLRSLRRNLQPEAFSESVHLKNVVLLPRPRMLKLKDRSFCSKGAR